VCRRTRPKKWPVTFSVQMESATSSWPTSGPTRLASNYFCPPPPPTVGTTLSAVSCGASRQRPVAKCAARARTSPPAPFSNVKVSFSKIPFKVEGSGGLNWPISDEKWNDLGESCLNGRSVWLKCCATLPDLPVMKRLRDDNEQVRRRPIDVCRVWMISLKRMFRQIDFFPQKNLKIARQILKKNWKLRAKFEKNLKIAREIWKKKNWKLRAKFEKKIWKLRAKLEKKNWKLRAKFEKKNWKLRAKFEKHLKIAREIWKTFENCARNLKKKLKITREIQTTKMSRRTLETRHGVKRLSDRLPFIDELQLCHLISSLDSIERHGLHRSDDEGDTCCYPLRPSADRTPSRPQARFALNLNENELKVNWRWPSAADDVRAECPSISCDVSDLYRSIASTLVPKRPLDVFLQLLDICSLVYGTSAVAIHLQRSTSLVN
jgi:hypothetical protein